LIRVPNCARGANTAIGLDAGPARTPRIRAGFGKIVNLRSTGERVVAIRREAAIPALAQPQTKTACPKASR
jgi:hypothetical protein